MIFNSLKFLFVFPIVFMIYFAVRKEVRYLWLLFISYVFYMMWSPKYAVILILITVLSYTGALLIGKNHPKLCLGIAVTACLGILGILKYSAFFVNILNRLFGFFKQGEGAVAFELLLPIGISFYTLQAVGYLIDVYRGKTEPERNFAKYALFLSFFPIILSGPIERSDNLLRQIREGTNFNYDDAKSGVLLFLWGCFEKILIADRIGMIVDVVYSDYGKQTGAALLLAVILYSVQIYADFSGYSHMAIGISGTLGFHLPNNFEQPYFALNIQEFWRKWHISLSSWLRDYVYIPLGGSRCGKLRSYFNLFVTFVVSGIWHGAGMHYIIWGGIHGFYQVFGKITRGIRNRVLQASEIKTDCFSYHLLQRLITFVMVTFAWIFFRATSVSQAFGILRRIFTQFQLKDTWFDKTYLFGMESGRMQILILEIIVLIVVDALREKKISLIKWLNQQNRAFRWAVYILFIMVLLTGAIRNYGAEASTFIYAQF